MSKPNCVFYKKTDKGGYCSYCKMICEHYEICEFHLNGVGPEDLKGALIGIDGGGNPIYSEE